MSTDLATIRNGSIEPAHDLGTMVVQYTHLAEQIARTEFVPAEFRGRPEAVLAAMLYGNELGLGPMQSLNLMRSIKGSVGLKPEGMRGLVRQRGHRIWPVEMTDTKVTLAGQRQGDPPDVIVQVTWTLDDAKRAGLGTGDNWRKYPRAMLVARATSELCRLHFADVIGGLSYTPEELGDFDDAPGFTPTPPVAPAPRPADHETGEIKQPTPATSRRRPPPQKAAEPGLLTPGEWKGRLLDAVIAQGISRSEAEKVCKTFITDKGGFTDSLGITLSLPEEQVAALIAELTGPADAETPAAEPEPEEDGAPLTPGAFDTDDEGAPF